MSAWYWYQLFGGFFFLYIGYQEHRKRPDRKIWLLGVIAGLGFIAMAVFHI